MYVDKGVLKMHHVSATLTAFGTHHVLDEPCPEHGLGCAHLQVGAAQRNLARDDRMGRMTERA